MVPLEPGLAQIKTDSPAAAAAASLVRLAFLHIAFACLPLLSPTHTYTYMFCSSRLALATDSFCSSQKEKTSPNLLSFLFFTDRLQLANSISFIMATTNSSSDSRTLCSEFDSCDVVDNNAGSDPVATSDYTEVVVVRHGETKWNADGKLQGHLDVELNEIGRDQAAAVANRLSKESKVSAVYSSDLSRALETAKVIAASCGGLQVVQDKDLRERNLGDLQGLSLREAEKLKPKAYEAFVSRTRAQDIPGGGESLDQLYERCTSALEKIAAKHRGERVVVVAHGGVIRAFYKRASPKKRLGKSESKILNASVNIFHLSGEGDWEIKTWGDVSHLDDDMYLEDAFGGDKNSG